MAANPRPKLAFWNSLAGLLPAEGGTVGADIRRKPDGSWTVRWWFQAGETVRIQRELDFPAGTDGGVDHTDTDIETVVADVFGP